ncbi:hypothetical protein HUX88_30340 [Duganella sp. BJB1802]|uniref:hypothetical protein n=1 Tax=Duganella sp. BJB1802 TaxID=2744575 RepID=UPI001594D3A1|nr:hypothetical protein [Duganella sp. BJB1802]NVD74791.1 hypothetical protein [Duganella sp. BJB1802]
MTLQLSNKLKFQEAVTGQERTIDQSFIYSMYVISEEAAWIGRLPFERQLRFLARLSFELTVAGRNSYEVGTDNLEHPQQLRRVNEIQHRVSACLSQLVNGTCPDGFVESMAERVLTN